jgi:uncharacterized protein (UPF0218 family)
VAVVELPQSLRAELKEPLGPVFTDAEALLDRAGAPLVAVGDVVTYHLLAAGRVPDVALVDGRTERSAVDDEIRDGIGGFDREVRVANPPATLTDELLEALTGGLDSGETTLLVVDGEEDLATLPAVVAATRGSAVVYGQPGEGMVLVTVDRRAADRARELLARMDGDTDRLWALLGTDRDAQD